MSQTLCFCRENERLACQEDFFQICSFRFHKLNSLAVSSDEIGLNQYHMRQDPFHTQIFGHTLLQGLRKSTHNEPSNIFCSTFHLTTLWNSFDGEGMAEGMHNGIRLSNTCYLPARKSKGRSYFMFHWCHWQASGSYLNICSLQYRFNLFFCHCNVVVGKNQCWISAGQFIFRQVLLAVGFLFQMGHFMRDWHLEVEKCGRENTTLMEQKKLVNLQQSASGVRTWCLECFLPKGFHPTRGSTYQK